MFVLVTVLIVIVAVLLAAVVLVQNSKGGGLAANFASGNQTFGVRKTADFLEKATWTLAIRIIVLCIAATAFVSTRVQENNSTLIEKIENTAPVAQPQFPVDAAAPATEVPAADTTK